MYTKEQLMPKRYPVNKPSEVGDYIVYYENYRTDGGEILKNYWVDNYWNGADWWDSGERVKQFIPIPLEPENNPEQAKSKDEVNDERIQKVKKWLNTHGYDIVKREPEIAPCPNPECGDDCYIDSCPEEPDEHQVVCNTCKYRGPKSENYAEAIRLHNAIAGRE